MSWEKLVDGKWVPQPSSGRPLQKMRAVRAGPDLRPAKRRLKRYLIAQRRRAWRPTVTHRDPSSSTRAAPVQLVAIGGRDGDGARDDGGGGGGDDGGGDGPPPPRLKSKYGPRAESQTPRTCAPRVVLNGRARS
jgi:hypothetical protein